MQSIDYNYINSFFECEKERGVECAICIEGKNCNFSKYAHSKAHQEAHTLANTIAEKFAIEKIQSTYIDYYMLFYRREYANIYNYLLKKYADEYYNILLHKSYNTNEICSYHIESQCHNHKIKCDNCGNLFDDNIPDLCPTCEYRKKDINYHDESPIVYMPKY